MTHAYYNEHDKFAADWLRNLIKAGLIADGEVDTRSIVDVRPGDLRGFGQCHFFAGIGGWSYALRSAGWADGAPVWTGSCPCQPFSLAGAQRGFADERHLWPVWRELIRECNPAIVFGEQVASATEWLGLVRSDLEALGYAVGALPIQAASAGADHLRDRYWFVADDGSGRCAGSDRREGEQPRRTEAFRTGHSSHLGIADCGGRAQGQQAAEAVGHWNSAIATSGGVHMVNPSRFTEREPNDEGNAFADGGEARSVPCGASNPIDVGHPIGTRAGRDGGNGRSPEGASSGEGHSDGRGGDAPEPSGAALDWVIGADGKARRVKSGIRLLAHGVPNRVGLLRGFGNAIDHRPAAAFIEAYMTTRPSLATPSHQNQTEAS
jgi:DNA (cytosine-5)-methyltransferase 1